MNGIELVGIVAVFTASFGAVYLRLGRVQADVARLNTKVKFIYDNLNVALNFKEK